MPSSNIHKDLSDPNIHNPKGYADAPNETVLTKGVGTGGYQNGSLQWVSNTKVGTTNYDLICYAPEGNANYLFGEDVANNKSPFLLGDNYGSSSVAEGEGVSPSQLIRMGIARYVTVSSTVTSIKGYATLNTRNNIVIAICKITPNPASSENIVPTVIDEITVTGQANNSLMVAFNETTITTPTVAAGDYIFPMVKEVLAEGSEEYSAIYINGIIQTVTNK